MSRARFVTGAEAGLSGEDQIVIALKVIESLGGVAQIQDIYWAVENHLSGASLSGQGKASLRRLINSYAVKAGYLFPYDVNNPGWSITDEGRQFNQDKQGNLAKGLQDPRLAGVNSGIPIEVLELSVRTYNSLLRGGIDTVEHLLALTEDELLAVRNIGTLSIEEINEKINSAGAIHQKQNADIELGSYPIEINQYWAPQIPLKSLKLNARIQTVLLRADVRTLGDLIQRIASNTIRSINNLGEKIYSEIINSIFDFELIFPLDFWTGDFLDCNHITALQLSKTTFDDLLRSGISDVRDVFDAVKDNKDRGSLPTALIEARVALIAYLVSYAYKSASSINQEEKRALRPASEQYAEDNSLPPSVPIEDLRLDANTLDQLVDYLFSTLTEREKVVIRLREGFVGKEWTLQEIGEELEVSRERVRQLERKATDKIKKEILRSYFWIKGYPNSRFNLAPFRDVLDNTCSYACLEKELVRKLKRKFEYPNSRIDQPLLFILKILGFEEITSNVENQDPIFINSESADVTHFNLLITNIDFFLTKKYPYPASEKEIQANVGGPKLGEKYDHIFRVCLQLTSTIEECGIGFYRGRFEYLKSWKDQAERLLKEKREPIHYKEMARMINERVTGFRDKKVRVRNLANQMASDERFAPIGKSGYWALSEWGVEQSTILELMSECLENEKRPLTHTEIYHYVDDRRPVTESSITLYLGFNDEFQKVGLDQWVLSSWPEARTLKTWDIEGVAEFLEEVFQNHGKNVLPFSDLRNQLKEAAFVSTRQAQGMLNHSPAIRTFRKHGGGELLAEYQMNYREIIESGQPRWKRKATLGDRIAQIVQDMLDDAPDHCIPLRELVDHLVIELDRPRHNFYGYISKLEFVEKRKDNESSEIICCLVDHND